MEGGASRDTGGPTSRADGAVRDDPSGEITRSLGRLIAQGSAIAYRLEELVCEPAPGAQAHTIEQWRLVCLQTLQAAFPCETAREFLHASEPARRPGRRPADADAAGRRMRDALALLHELKRTLEPRGRAPGCGNPRELTAQRR